MSKIISYILNVLLAIMMIVIIVGTYYMYQVKIQKKDYANLWGYSLFEVGTGSMLPTIEIGDVVITKITKDVEENDIIVYIEDDDIITHRLIEKNEERLITRGDANNSEDKPIEENMIIGKVVKIIPQLGTWQNILSSPEILSLIILLLSIIYAYTSKTEEKDDK